jgi:hypothetical protein
MCRKPLSRFVIAAVLVLGLLLPSAAAARGPVHTASRPGWGILPGSLWDLLLQLLRPAPRLKNSWTIDPDGATVAPTPLPQSDNGSQIDPNG